ncbi:MAG: ABC transporter ATP-binding protein [Deltaproteobacteria bacterium]|nr:ABC transporter ATP-binding protein [Deltaproteobacteria bacterium]
MSERKAAGSDKVWIEKVSKHYGGVIALAEVDLKVGDGEFLTLLGPSGSGKTTILNLIAGMVSPTTGRIWIDGNDATNVPVSKRGLGMVFQNYALMPHMTVFENIAFPLRVRKQSSAQITRRVNEVLDIVRLPEVAKRKPGELSGGQQQRVAIARCIAYNPPIILMDEPLGALDKKLREEMQLEIKQLHSQLGITALYVTHDQEEALTMSDRIVLLKDGRVEQAGPPAELYFHPRTLFSAEFLGDSNIIDCTVVEVGETVMAKTVLDTVVRAERVADAGAGAGMKMMVRPENVVLLRGGESLENMNRCRGELVDHIILGGVVKSYVRLANGSTMVVQELTQVDRVAVPPGTVVELAWSAADTLLLPSGDSARTST